MNKQDFILKYLHNELTDEEYDSFVSLTQTDNAFAEQVKLESILYAKHKQNIKEELIQHSIIKSGTSQSNENHPQKSTLKNLVPFIRNIAAAFVLAIAAYFLFIDRPSETLDSNSLVVNHLMEFHKPPSSLMSGDEVESDPWKIAIESYKVEKFELAIDQIENIPDKTNQQFLYSALSKLYSEDTQGAINDFKSILNGDNKMHQDEAQWFLSLAYLKSDNVDKAKSLLRTIIETKSWNANTASTLLDSLDK